MCGARPVPRTIVDFRREGPRAVVLGLDCGHRRHARHRPPLGELPWVCDDEAARGRVGSTEESVEAVPGRPVVIPAGLPHHLCLAGPVRFIVEFLRPPALEG